MSMVVTLWLLQGLCVGLVLWLLHSNGSLMTSYHTASQQGSWINHEHITFSSRLTDTGSQTEAQKRQSCQCKIQLPPLLVQPFPSYRATTAPDNNDTVQSTSVPHSADTAEDVNKHHSDAAAYGNWVFSESSTYLHPAYDSTKQQTQRPGSAPNDAKKASVSSNAALDMVTSSDTAGMDRTLDAMDMLTQHIPDPEMQGQRMLLNTYLRSTAFKQKLQAVARSPHKRGILMNAGGRKLLTNLVTTLKVVADTRTGAHG